ncbi:MAG: hypothetical protein ACE5JD_03880 [Candidatus Methylomirabilia bacterium]
MRALIFLLWALFLGFLLRSVVRWLLRQRLPSASPPPAQRADREELVKDPVCQTYVPRSRAVTRTVGGNMRYFCSPDCAARFAENLRS